MIAFCGAFEPDAKTITAAAVVLSEEDQITSFLSFVPKLLNRNLFLIPLFQIKKEECLVNYWAGNVCIYIKRTVTLTEISDV